MPLGVRRPSPQHLIDAFRAFQIPASYQERFGYPPLTREAKEQILSTNAQALYGVSGQTLRAVDAAPGSSRTSVAR